MESEQSKATKNKKGCKAKRKVTNMGINAKVHAMGFDQDTDMSTPRTRQMGVLQTNPGVGNASSNQTPSKYDTALAKLRCHAALDLPNPEKYSFCKYVFAQLTSGAKFAKNNTPPEAVNNFLKIVMMGDGEEGMSEEEKKASVQEMVNDTNNLLINLAVVAALVLSIVFGIAFEPVTLPADTIDYFGKSGATAVKHIYYFLICFIVIFAVVDIFTAITFYKNLNFFMTTIELKQWWLGNSLVAPVVVLTVVVLIAFLIVLPLGAAVTVGVTAFWIGLSVTMAGILTILGVGHFEFYEMCIQHRYVKNFVEELDKKHA